MEVRMSECPICRHFREMFPFVKQDPHPYYIKHADGCIYQTSAAETAIIDYDKATSRLQAIKGILAKTYPVNLKW